MPPSRQGQADQAATPPPADRRRPATPQSPIFRGGINFVRVDVIVTDKTGNPVADLKPTDFEVTEDGKPQKVETFKLVELDGGLMPGPDGPPRTIRTDDDEQAEAATDDVRLFGVFLDDYHVRQLSSMSARQAISRFIETQLGPSDMVGVMYPLESIDSVRLTRNHAAVSKGIQQFLGRKFDYTPRNQIEEKYAYYPTETVEKIRNQVSLSAIEGLIVHMGCAERRAQGADPGQRGLLQHAAAADARSDRRAARRRQRRGRQSAGRHQRSERRSRRIFRQHRAAERHARGLRRRQPQQRGDLLGRSARPGDQRIRHRSEHRDADSTAST